MDECVDINSWVCCLAAQGNHEGTARVIALCRDNTQGIDVNNTHPSMINPDYNMIITILVLNYQYSAY